MKVFVVTENILHEGEDIKEVFTTEEAAKAYCDESNDDNNKWLWYEYKEWEVREK